MSEWTTGEVITASKLNQKEVFIGDTAPASPTQGQLWFDTTVNRLKVYDGAAWKLVTAENLNEIATRSHADLQNIGANDHHAAFTSTDHDARDHSAVAGTIALSELGSKAHGELTGIGTDDHHAKLHQASHQKGGEDQITGTINPSKIELGTGRVFECIGGNGSIVIACQDGSGRLHIYWNAYYDSSSGVHRFIKAGDYAGWLLIHNDGKMQYRRSTSAAANAGDTITWGDITKIYDGKVEAPNGVIIQDTNLYRSAANQLKTDDSFEAGGVLKGAGYKNTSPSLDAPTRALDTLYQNTTGKTIVVYAKILIPGSLSSGWTYVEGFLGSTTSVVSVFKNTEWHEYGSGTYQTVVLIVPDQWYYKVTTYPTSGPEIYSWYEQTL
jgi:hypothetical protein